MTEQQAKSLHEKLEKLTGKTIDLKTKVDPADKGNEGAGDWLPFHCSYSRAVP